MDGGVGRPGAPGTHGAEGFARFGFAVGEVAVGDRGYARPKGSQHVPASGADFLVRVGWASLRPTTPEGEPLDWGAIHAVLAPGEVAEWQVVVTRHSRGPGRRGKPLFVARSVVVRQHPAVGERALRATRRGHKRRRARAVIQPLTPASTGCLMVLTSPPAEVASTAEVLAMYRLRWQVELAFKRLEGGLGLGRPLAHDEKSARGWLFAHLILALLIEDAAAEFLGAHPVRDAGPERPVSIRRLHGAIRAALLGAALRAVALADLRRATAAFLRHVCDPPRRRPSRAMQALARASRRGAPLWRMPESEGQPAQGT